MNDGIEDNDVVLKVGESRIILNMEEALRIASVINSSPRVTSSWSKDGTLNFIGGPEAVAVIVPITGVDRITWAKNAQAMKEKK